MSYPKPRIVNCALSTECFMRGNTLCYQRAIRLLKTGSDKGSYKMALECMRDDPWCFFENFENINDLKDGRYQLIVRFYEGTYEYPDDCDIEFELKEKHDGQ